MCFVSIGVVHANPLQTAPTVQTATATTSPSYMTAGTATTSLVFDSYIPGANKISDQAVLLIQLVASTTATTLNTNLEYSQDAIDWYQDGGTMAANYATTSKPFDISQVNQFKLNYATSTAGLAGIGATATSTLTRVLMLKTPTRYIRAVFTLPVGSAAGGVWAQFLASRQVSQ